LHIVTITIIGSKEAGKTTLFRQLVKHYSSPKREREIKSSPLINYAESSIKIGNNVYKLIDTPSFIHSPKTEIEKGIKEQTENLLKFSDLICWLIDKVSEEELLLKKYLKKFRTPQILIFNKLDLANSEEDFYSFQALRPQHFLTISALKRTNFDKLIEQITSLLPSSVGENTDQEEKKIKLLIFGPPNSGKSTLMNYLLQERRSLATPIAGTTQEPVVGQ
jgi:GTP-binding protein